MLRRAPPHPNPSPARGGGLFISTFTCIFLTLLLSGCMDWDNTQAITCRNTPQEQQQRASALGLTAWVSLTAGEETINLHSHQSIDVEELHLTPLGQSSVPDGQRLRLKPALEADWWLPMGEVPAAPLSGRYRVELLGSTLQDGSPRGAARCWRLSGDIDFSSHVGMFELKAPPA